MISKCETAADGTKRYYNNAGQLHNEHGPAIIWGSGHGSEYYINGKLHRSDGPAADYKTFKMWMINGKCHREEDPAILFDDNIDNDENRYFLNGKQVYVKSLTEFLGIVRFKAFI